MTMKLQRNQTLECCRILAAVFVVFLHVPFPGTVGKTVNCLARFAVPLFFAISGWFSYGAEGRKLLRRMGRILLLEAGGIGLTVLWKCLLTVSLGGSVRECLMSLIPGAQALGKWLVWNVDPFAGHLWYLSAMAACYGALWLYTRMFRGKETDYRALYLLSGFLLLTHFAMANFSRFTGIAVDYTVSRSGLFFGLPMFAMGIFLKQHRESLLKRRLIPVLVLGFGLSLLERFVLGPSDLPVAMPAAVAAMLLLTQKHPTVPEGWLRRASAWFGPLSTCVYIVHLIVLEAWQQWTAPHMGPAESWLRPIAVAAISLAVGTVWLRIKTTVQKIRK